MDTNKKLYIGAGIAVAVLIAIYLRKKSQDAQQQKVQNKPTAPKLPPITWVDKGDIVHKTSNDAVKKETGVLAWDAHGYSEEAFTKKASISGTINTNSTTAVLGLITDPEQKVDYGAGWFGTDYFWFFYDEDYRPDLGKALSTPRVDPRVECWKFDYATGQAVNLRSDGPWKAGEQFEVKYDEGKVTYLRNGEVVYIDYGQPTDKPLHAYVAFQRGGGKGISNIKFTDK
jgi:hypothetical protein